MNQTAARTMFEIYRDAGPTGDFRVVYFTELDSHERDDEIGRAMEGSHIFDGFLAAGDDAGKQRIAAVLDRLNRGERLAAAEIEAQLSGHLV
jgi:hypothetical protein